MQHLRMKPGMQQHMCQEKRPVGWKKIWKLVSLYRRPNYDHVFQQIWTPEPLPSHLSPTRQMQKKKKKQWYPEGRHRKKTVKSYFAVVSSSYFVFRSNSSVLVFSKAKRHKHEALQHCNSSEKQKDYSFFFYSAINKAVHLLMKNSLLYLST